MTDAVLVCENHPGRETSLRCNRCGKPICSQCAIQTPVGYRCKECVRGQQKIFDTATTIDYPIAVVIAAVGVGVSVAILNFIGFWGFFVAPVIGGGLGEVVRRAVRRRRSRRLPLAAALGGAIGVLPHLILPLTALAFASSSPSGTVGVLGAVGLSAVFPLIYAVLMVSTMYYRLRGIRM